MNMEVVSPANPEIDENNKMGKMVISFISSHSRKLWNRLINIFPQTHSRFLGFVSLLYIQFTRATRSTNRRNSLPLPLSRKSLATPSDLSETSKFIDVLEDILEHAFRDLHKIEKNLEFWHSRAQGSNSKRVYFMLLERGPLAFLGGTAQLIRKIFSSGSSVQHLCDTASAYLSERITVLTHLKYALASFLGQIYLEVDKVGDELVSNPEKSLPLLLMAVNELFLKLEASLGELHVVSQDSSKPPTNPYEILESVLLNEKLEGARFSHAWGANLRNSPFGQNIRTLHSGSSVDESYTCPLLFEKLPEVNQEGSEWTECETRDAINLIYQNLHKLDSFVSILVAKHQKPRKTTLYWTRYTFGVIGLSVCSMWLIRHSSLGGSPDIDNWIRDARDSTLTFWADHVEQPLLSIRNEVFETFKKRDGVMMARQEVELTADSLRIMLWTLCKEIKGPGLPENTSTQELLAIVMNIYVNELVQPIRNLFGGELARVLLIQLQKLKLDVETVMLELDQILRANQINFAILAALPALGIFVILVGVIRAWYKKDTRAEGRGQAARIQRRLLVAEAQQRIEKYQKFMDKDMEQDAQYAYGLVLYSLNRLYHAVKSHAKETGEWKCLRKDIIDLAKPGLERQETEPITSRFVGLYFCLLPPVPKK